jgi:hypothetical protein
MSRKLPCPLCGRKVTCTVGEWARHLVYRCRSVDAHRVYNFDIGLVRCPCGQTLGTVELDEYEDAAAEAVGRLFAHFYTDVKLGRAFNLNAHMILWRFFPPPEDPLPF